MKHKENPDKSSFSKPSSKVIVFLALFFSVFIIFVYSYFSYPKIYGSGVGVSTNTPFLQLQEKSNTININTAPLEELTILPGIGTAKANAIIEYRENNDGFNSIEEIKNISGIGEKIFEDIKPLISI